MKPRPKCVHCGKLYGVRAVNTEQIKYCIGDNPAPYTGNNLVLRESSPYRTSDDQMVISRTIWDGESYFLSYEPFCTLRCALGYARIAFRRIGPIR